VSLDVFSLGAIAFFLVTGEPPASAYGVLSQRLKAQGALHPASQANGIAEDLDHLVAHATEADAARRTPDAETFLAELEAVVVSLAADEVLAPVVAATEADQGDEPAGEYRVERRLGTGSTAVALLVSPVDDAEERAALKVALDERKAARLHAEAATLALLGDQPGLARLLDGPREIGNRTALAVSFAGDRTLAQELRERGRLQPEWLQTWGGDLLATLDYLERAGVAHRDSKPDNLGVAERKVKGRKGLVLFDFSLSGVPREDTEAGTPPYLDPFLGTAGRRVWDQAAERHAVAVTLCQMRVVTALERLGVSTAGEAAALPEAKLRWPPGAGSRTRELLLAEVPALATRLAESAGSAGSAGMVAAATSAAPRSRPALPRPPAAGVPRRAPRPRGPPPHAWCGG
jgi:hypothetical protein